MTKKYTIDYILFPHHNDRVVTHRTDDPVEAEDFLAHLLAAGARIIAIRHDTEELTQHQFDRMVKIAAEGLMVRLLVQSLKLDVAAIRHRFGFAG